MFRWCCLRSSIASKRTSLRTGHYIHVYMYISILYVYTEHFICTLCIHICTVKYRQLTSLKFHEGKVRHLVYAPPPPCVLCSYHEHCLLDFHVHATVVALLYINGACTKHKRSCASANSTHVYKVQSSIITHVLMVGICMGLKLQTYPSLRFSLV